MADEADYSAEQAELEEAIERTLASTSPKKLVIAGPGTGKTTLFRRMLELSPGEPQERIVLTFINNLKNDLEEDLGDIARVHTLHSYCLGLLHSHPALRNLLPEDFRCCPGIASIIANDFEMIERVAAPNFVGDMRSLAGGDSAPFYLARGNYYGAVDFDDIVYRAYTGLSSGNASVDSFKLVLIDEYQDFNALEAGIIDVLAEVNPILIAGDDDQALYSQLRNASWDHIRNLSNAGEYEVHMLPFCLRCPKVVVDAVNDVIKTANNSDHLSGRIEKPYKHFPPVKGPDSIKYPYINRVQTSVQRQNVNYMGRYIAQAIDQIPEDEIEMSLQDGYPTALVIIAQPYRNQIIEYLEGAGYMVDTKREVTPTLSRDAGLAILKEDPEANLGWRIVLEADKPSFLRTAIEATADNYTPLMASITKEYRDRVLTDAENYEPPQTLEVTIENTEGNLRPTIKVTSFEGAKGLSSQHVYITGLHNGELPHDPASIKDLEICKFIVGLTRTRKKCTLIYTRNFAGEWKTPSCFLDWINAKRFVNVTIDAAYWKRLDKAVD